MKIKNFCSVKDTLKENKDNLWSGRKKIVNTYLIKYLYPKRKNSVKLYRENLKFHSKKTNNQI